VNELDDTLDAGTIARIVGGRLSGNSRSAVVRARADSRLCRPGDLYVALPGERTDGSLFVESAWSAGSSVVLADQTRRVPRPPKGKALVEVSDPLASLQRLAKTRREQAAGLKVVGITGSNGKTTTKDILAAILVDWKGEKVLATEGNYNSEIGLPLTMIDLRARHELAVLEMGMNRQGEMALLADIGKPDVAVITNIGSAHVGMLGSRKAVAEEKRAIFNGAGKDTVAVIGADEPWKDFLLEYFPGVVRPFGVWGLDGWESAENRGLDGHRLVRNGRAIDFPLPGRHSVLNAMAAVAAASALGAPEDSIVKGLESVKASFGRSEVMRGRVTVIRDCYNANPESLQAALDLFAETEANGKRVLVLGELLELGGETEGALRKAGGAAVAAGPDVLFLYGESMSLVETAAKDAGFDGQLRCFTDIGELELALSAVLGDGDLVLLKGSRGSALERLNQVFTEVGAG
jgi:UDP-N-acetylmuramoyl-tripeptide--D-alanyl-D-alanine ligase